MGGRNSQPRHGPKHHKDTHQFRWAKTFALDLNLWRNEGPPKPPPHPRMDVHPTKPDKAHPEGTP